MRNPVFLRTIAALLLLISAALHAKGPPRQFLDSVLLLRPGISDLGDMTVRQYVEMLSKASLSDGTKPKIVGWTNIRNRYTLTTMFEFQPTLLTFVHDLSAQVQGAGSLLLPVRMGLDQVDALQFTMFIAGSIPHDTEPDGTMDIEASENVAAGISTEATALEAACAGLATTAEQLICSNDALRDADEEMSQAYRDRLMETKDREAFLALQSQQMRWRQERRDKCTDAACMLDAHRVRVQELSR